MLTCHDPYPHVTIGLFQFNSLKKNCFALASDLFKKRWHEYDWNSDNWLCVGIAPNRGNVRAETFRDWVLCGCRN